MIKGGLLDRALNANPSPIKDGLLDRGLTVYGLGFKERTGRTPRQQLADSLKCTGGTDWKTGSVKKVRLTKAHKAIRDRARADRRELDETLANCQRVQK